MEDNSETSVGKPFHAGEENLPTKKRTPVTEDDRTRLKGDPKMISPAPGSGENLYPPKSTPIKQPVINWQLREARAGMSQAEPLTDEEKKDLGIKKPKTSIGGKLARWGLGLLALVGVEAASATPPAQEIAKNLENADFNGTRQLHPHVSLYDTSDHTPGAAEPTPTPKVIITEKPSGIAHEDQKPN